MLNVRVTTALQCMMFLIIYSPGPAWVNGKSTKEQPLLEHGRYMLDLHRRDIMQSAGPFVGHEGGAALVIAANESDAREIVDADPAVRSGVFVYTLRQWKQLNWQEIGAKHSRK